MRQNHKFDEGKARRFLGDIREIRTPFIASLDELSVMLNHAPTHGYGLRGRRAVVSQPRRRTVSPVHWASCFGI